MQVAFWSHYHGQTATTSNMVAMTMMMALEERFSMLLTQSHFNKNNLDNTMLTKNFLHSELTDLSDTGVDALSRFIKSNKISPQEFANYTTTVLKNKVDLLEGTKLKNWDIYQKEFRAVMQTIFESANKYYDFIFVDVAAGIDEISTSILEDSDLVIVNLCQNTMVLEDYFHYYQERFNNVLYLIGNYNPNSKLNVRNIKRMYGIKESIGVIPYNIEFSDACSDGKVVDYFIRNLGAHKLDENYLLLHETRQAIKQLLTMLGLSSAPKEMEA